MLGFSLQGRPRASEFGFARLCQDSGDWDYNPKVAAKVLSFSFLFMTGHKLVRFSEKEGQIHRSRISLVPGK